MYHPVALFQFALPNFPANFAGFLGSLVEILSEYTQKRLMSPHLCWASDISRPFIFGQASVAFVYSDLEGGHEGVAVTYASDAANLRVE
jgi:hypothetical protein